MSNRLNLLAAQEGAWYSHQLDPGSSGANVGEYVEFLGPIDPSCFAAALRSATSETDALQARFVTDPQSSTLHQVVDQDAIPELRHVDVSQSPDPDTDARAWMAEDLGRPIDPTREPCSTDTLIRLGSGRFLWYKRWHQMVFDGYSWSLFSRRVAQRYGELAAGTGPSPRPLGSLADVVAEEARYRASDQFAADRAYWMEQAAGDHSSGGVVGTPAPEGSGRVRRSFRLPAGLSAQLAEAAKAHDVRWSRFFIALTAAYLSRITGDDVVLGVPVAARVAEIERRTPCKLSNVLPLPVALAHDPDLATLAQSVTGDVDRLVEHQRYRSEDLRRDLALPIEEGRFAGPIVNVVRFDWQLQFGAVQAVVHNLSAGPVEDISILIRDRRDRSEIEVVLEANPGRHDHDDLRRHEQRFVRLLADTAASDPRRRVSELSLVGAIERGCLVAAGRGREAPTPSDRSVHDVVVEQVERSPEAVAVVEGDRSLTYAELGRLSAGLAGALRRRGVGPDVPVGLWMDRSIEMVVALLGILRAGGAYVPIDPDVPGARVTQLVGAVGAPVLATQPGWAEQVDLPDAAVVEIDEAALRDWAERHPAPPGRKPVADNLVSIYYTSGSTGAPKGVASSHRGWVNRLRWMQERYELHPDESVLHKTVLSFDDSAVEVLWPLMVGARVAVLPAGLHRDPRAILHAAVEHRVAVLQFVPSMLGLFLDEVGPEHMDDLARLRVVVSSGEALRPELVATFHERLGSTGCRLHNQWGATEVSIDSTEHCCRPDDGRTPDVPIGGALVNNRVLVLDRHLEPVPVGVPGDLYLGGVGLARGYWEDPARTAQAFIPDPFGNGERLYRTGDQGLRRPDGELVCLGRSDHQIKIRGIRVEPGEIEHALRDHPQISDAVVVKWEPAPGDARLAAYIVTDSDGSPDPDSEELAGYLNARFPAYMVPAVFVGIETIPLTPSGKVDRKRLPEPQAQPVRPRQVTGPRNDAEAMIAGVWSEVLGLAEIDIDDNFFTLGGHSLLATKVISRLRHHLDTDIPLSLLFDHPTINHMATALLEWLESAEPIAEGAVR